MALALPSGTRGQMLALGLALLAAVVIWIGAVAPVWGWYDDRAELLRRQRAIAHRMASLVETLPALRRQVATVAGEAASSGAASADTTAVLLTGTSDPVAAASLQQRIEELAMQAGVRVGSEEILPAQAEGDLRAIAVRLTLTAPFRSLVAMLLALSRSETPMVADELLLRGPPGRPGENDLPVDVSLTVTSYRSAKAETP
jgi:general secretion pathway protein M